MNDNPLRVVVADDEPDVRLLLSMQLGDAGIEVVGEAADGQEAIARCRETEPDALVLDLLMPRVNGFEVIPLLQRDHPDVLIVAYTAVAGDYVRREMDRLGVPLVLKSGEARPLLSALRDANGRHSGGDD